MQTPYAAVTANIEMEDIREVNCKLELAVEKSMLSPGQTMCYSDSSGVLRGVITEHWGPATREFSGTGSGIITYRATLLNAQATRILMAKDAKQRAAIAIAGTCASSRVHASLCSQMPSVGSAGSISNERVMVDFLI